MAASPPTAAPDRLRAQVLAEWAPVTPLRSPWRRAAWIAPLAAVTAGIAATYWGPQPDWAAPGFVLTATLSAVQWTAGLALLALALREAVPGRTTRPAAMLAVLAAVVVILAVNLAAKDSVAAAVVPAGREWRFWALCFRGPLMLAGPVLVLGSLFAARAFPTRPAWAGALAGLAAGVLSDAGWRLGCSVTEASHVVGAHWLAIGMASGLGAALVSVADAVRWRR
ncbi:MAG: NrsF family protein [Vicinamibacteraceae bacterium]